jgi:hypothetical protein
MLENWVKIFVHKELLQVKLAEDILKQNNIESHIASKPDSVIQPLGEAVLYVPREKGEAALDVLKKNDFL